MTVLTSRPYRHIVHGCIAPASRYRMRLSHCADVRQLYDSISDAKRFRRLLSKWVYRKDLPWLHQEMNRLTAAGRMCKIFYRSTKHKIQFTVVGV